MIIVNFLKIVFRLTRFEGWISKLPGYTVATYAIMALGAQSLSYPQSMGFLYLIGHLVTGYVGNDIADWGTDMISGDSREIHSFSSRGRISIFIVFCVLHFWLMIYIAGDNMSCLIILGTLFVLHLLYSFPPRFKNRGIFGILSSAFNQWVAPFLAFLILAKEVIVSSEMKIGALLIVFWLFAVGCNGAVRHQIHDFSFDTNNVGTFVQEFGVGAAFRILPVIQGVAIISPALFFMFISFTEALVVFFGMSSFAIYHTLYYKRLRIYGRREVAT